MDPLSNWDGSGWGVPACNDVVMQNNDGTDGASFRSFYQVCYGSDHFLVLVQLIVALSLKPAVVKDLVLEKYKGTSVVLFLVVRME